MSGYFYIDPDDEDDLRQEAFQVMIAEIWQNANGAERKVIARERGAFGIIDKAWRDLTPTEFRIWQECLRADYYAKLMADEMPEDLPW